VAIHTGFIPYTFQLSSAFWNHGSAVACVLVLEPDPEVRDLVALVARRLGHEVLNEVSTPAVRLDVVVLEPESSRSFLAAQVLRERFPELPIIVSSIAPPSSRTAELRPLAYLQKPFTLGELQHALVRAVPASSSSDAA
jgi:hypothetical protein